MQPMSPRATGGSGVHYEAEVAACALSLLLSGHRGPSRSQQIRRVALQQRAVGAQLDDMVLHTGVGSSSRTVECQIKITVTAPALREVLEAAAKMRRMHPGDFAADRRRMLLVTRTTAKTAALRQLVELAQPASLDEFQAQLTPGQSPEAVRREWDTLRRTFTGRDADHVAHGLLTRLDVWLVDRDGRGTGVDYIRILDTVAQSCATSSEHIFLCLKDIGAKLSESGGDIDADRLRHRLVQDYGILLFGAPPITAGAASIRRFLPLHPLSGREPELEQLARHCTSDQEPAYLCWRGPAWAGKTALLAWFAEHPPAGVRVLATFVTARSGVRDRVTFVDDQLAELTEQFGLAPETLRPCGLRDGALLARWAQAAATCVAQGMRLAVIIDGLDEDTAARFEVSIAGLLPPRAPAGLRFVVSIRDRRPLPEDVDDNHPLRVSPWRDLSPSPSARMMRSEVLTELTAIWRDRPVGHDVLGFVAAARGGLTRHDLAALCRQEVGAIDDLVASSAARSVGRDLDGGYVLIHEELHAAVIELFGSFTTFLVRIDAWADEYQAAGWPADTPHYLLHGYPLARQDSPARLLALATDAHRRERLFTATGADAAALREITLAESVHRAANPDLGALLRLALLRQRLTRQTRVVPAGLPAVIAQVHGWERAVALAMSSDIGSFRNAALVDLMNAARTPAQCSELIDRISSPVAKALAQVRGLPVIGHLPDDFCATITEPDERARVLAAAARALGPDRAAGSWWEKLVHDGHDAARAADNDLQRGLALAWLTHLPGADAPALLDEALDTVGAGESITASMAMRQIAVAFARAGAVDRAIALAASVSHPYDGWALGDVAAEIAHADPVVAERLAASVAGPSARISALVAVSRVHAAAGRRAEARRLAEAGYELLSGDTDVVLWEGVHTAVAAALAAAGDLDSAVTAARSADWYREIAEGLTAVAAAAAEQGDLTTAAELAREVHQTIRSDDGHDEGPIEVMDQIRGYRPNPPTPDPVLAKIDGLLEDGQVEAAEQVAQQLSRGPLRDEALSELSSAIAVEGDPRRGESLIDEIDDPRRQAEALMWLARHAKPAEYPERLPALAAMAHDRLRQPTDRGARADLICTIAEHDPKQAAGLARRAFDQDDVMLAYTLAAIASTVHDRSFARHLLAEALLLEQFEPAISVIAMIEPAAVQAAAADIAGTPAGDVYQCHEAG
ncbi:hypothetical protein ACQP2X_35375 [Actinoplanes sp. CA-131856]